MFDIHQSPFDEDGDWSDELRTNYCEELVQAFFESPEGKACEEHYGELGWTYTFLDFGLSYPGKTPPDMSLGDVDEILYDLFPRKVSVEPDRAGDIVGELRAFWEFLGREYALRQAPQIIEKLGRSAVQRLQAELSDPANFGMAKSFFMTGDEMGFDMTSEEGMNEFVAAYNASIPRAQAAPTLTEPPAEAGPARPKGKSIGGLSSEERKAREKLRAKKLGKSKKKRR